MDWIPLKPLATELGMSLGTAAHKVGLRELGLKLSNRTIDGSSFMSTNDLIKQYAFTKADVVTTQEGVARLKAR